MKDRIAQVIYVLGILGAVGMFGFTLLVLGFVALNPEEFEIEMIPGSLAMIGMGLGSYGAGWAIRYILTGVTTTVLSRGSKA